MSITAPEPRRLTDESAGSDPRRWFALGVLGLVQFMLVLDMTVVNVALPRIQHDLSFTSTGLAWVVNGYVLMAGGLLLLGGRLADIFGRRRLFLTGVCVFALASVACGAALSPEMLVSSRFVQGIGEALAAPASLGLIALMFTDPRERMKALGIWGGIAGLGGVSGSVISGAFTDLASWRWVFYINVPVAILALLVVPRLVNESKMVRGDHRLDLPGAFTAASGLVAVVYGFLQAATHPWDSLDVLLPLLVGVLLLAAMVAIEALSDAPLIPLRFFSNRTRVIANVASLLNAAAFFTYVFVLTLFEQQVLGYSPLTGGLSYLALGFGIGAGVGISTWLMPRLGVKPVMGLGFFGAAAGLVMTSFIDVDSSYLGAIMPGMIVVGVFSGLCMPAVFNAALHEVTAQDSSLASGVQSAMQAIGGALGLACLVTLAHRHALGLIHDGVVLASAETQGYVLALRIAAVLLAVGGILIMVLLKRVPVQSPALGEDETQQTPRTMT